MPNGYTYAVRLTPTAQTAAKTLIQIKTGAAPIELLSFRINQITLKATEMWSLQIIRKSATATVTSFTPLQYNPGDPASLAVGGTSATGTNASAEGTDGDIDFESYWNIISGEYLWLPVPEERIWVPQTAFIALKLNTAPSASSTIGCTVVYREWR